MSCEKLNKYKHSRYIIPLIVFSVIIFCSTFYSNYNYKAQGTHILLEDRSNESGESTRSQWGLINSFNIIQSELIQYVPNSYVIGPIESSCYYEWSYPPLWYVSLNHLNGTWSDEDAKLQIWQPKSDMSQPNLFQEFVWNATFIHEIGWVDYNSNKYLYVISQHIGGWTTLTCLTLSPNNSRLNILSEETYRSDLCWFIPDIPIYGPTFVFTDPSSRYELDEPNSLGSTYVRLCPYSNKGFISSYYIRVDELLTRTEIDLLKQYTDKGELLMKIIEVKFRTTTAWQGRLQTGKLDSHLYAEKYNLDGTTYTSFACGTGWVENNEIF